MVRYEILMITIPGITQDEAADIEKQLQAVVTSFKGALISFERWGKYRFPFQIKKNDYGVYFLVRLEIQAATVAFLQAINAFFTLKVNDIVMRKKIMRLPAQGSLTYVRPPSLEEAPANNIDTLLKEKKAGRFFKRRSGNLGSGSYYQQKQHGERAHDEKN